jgi:perosamine synthetase
MNFRYQAPAYSPLAPADLARAAFAGGESIDRLGAFLRERFHADRALLTGSGTQALTLALSLAVRVRPDRPRVALPGYSCYSIASAAVGAGVDVVLYDLDPETLAPDGDSLRRALQAGAGIVVAAPLFGLPLNWEVVEGLAREHDAFLVEDAAQAGGGLWRGRELGSLGVLSVLSFSRGKGWTGGGGGALLAREGAPELPDQVPSGAHGLKPLLKSGAQWAMGRPALYRIPAGLPFLRLGETIYHPPDPVSEMPRAAAALAMRTHRHQEREVEVRRANAAWYRERLVDVDAGRRSVNLVRIEGVEDGGWLRYPVRLKGGWPAGMDRKKAVAVGVAGMYPEPLYKLAELAPLLVERGDRLPGAEELARWLVTLPTHSLVTPQDRAAAADLFCG